MHGALDNLLVSGVLLVSVVYATHSLGPKALRRRISQGAANALRKLPAALHLRSAAQRFEAASQKAGGSCGGCDNCGSAAPVNDAKSSTAPAGSTVGSATEIRIPLSTIRRR